MDSNTLLFKGKCFFESIYYMILISFITIISFGFNCLYIAFFAFPILICLQVICNAQFVGFINMWFMLSACYRNNTISYSSFGTIMVYIFFAAMASVSIFDMIRNRKVIVEKIKKDIHMYSFIGMIIAMIISLINTPTFGMSMLEIGNMLYLAILFIYFMIKTDFTEDNKRKICVAIVIVALTLSAEVLIKFVSIYERDTIMDVLKGKGYGDAALSLGWGLSNHYIAIINAGIIFAIAVFLMFEKIRYKFFSLISISVFGIINILCMCRGGYLGLVFVIPCIVAAVIYHIMKKPNEKKINAIILSSYFVFLMAIFAIMCFGFGYINLVKSVISKGFDTSERIKVYKLAIDNFKDHWLIGTGVKSSRYYLKDSGISWNELYNYHNHFLQILSTCGILGAISFILYLAASIHRVSKKDWFSAFVGILLLYYFVHGSVDTIMFNNKIWPVLVMLIAFVPQKIGSENENGEYIVEEVK